MLRALAAMAAGLVALAWIRHRFFRRSFVSVTLGGVIIAALGAALGAVS